MSDVAPRATRPGAQPDLGLWQRLRHRFYLLTILLGAGLSLGLPVVFFAAEYAMRARDAQWQARALATELGEAVAAASASPSPRLSGGETAFAGAASAFLAAHGAESVRVRDEAGRVVAGFESLAAPGGGWWALPRVIGSVPLVVRGARLGTVEVTLSLRGVVAISAGLLLVSTAAGAGLAVLTYGSALRAATSMEAQIRGLVRSLEEARGESERLRTEAETSAREYRSVVDSIQQVVFRTDERGRWTFLSAAWTEVTGLAAADCLGKAFLEFVHPEDRMRHAELVLPLMGGSAGHLGREVRYRTRAGGTRWMEVYARVLAGDGGRVTGTFGTLTDVTERKQAEEELVSIRERLTHLLASSPAVIHSRQAGDGFRLTFVSDNVARLFGWDAEELLEAPGSWDRLVHPDDAPAVARRRERILEDAQQVHEYRFRCRDGSWRWVQDEWRVARAESAPAQEIVGTVVDITERRQAEEARARLSSAVEQASDAIVITDPAGGIVYVNPAFERATGHAGAEVIGQDLRTLKEAEAGSGFSEALTPGLAGAQPWAGRLAGKRRDGTLTEEEATISPVCDAAGRLVNHVVLVRDVTRERRMEEQLRQSQKMEAVGRLAGGVAHDFNNLLTVITGRCYFLQRAVGDGAIARDVGLIHDATQRAAALTRQLLAFSRRQVLEMRVLDVNAIVAQMEKMLRRLIGEDIELATVRAADLGCVKADLGQLEQVIMNLVVNARDAMPRGGRLAIETGNVVGEREGDPQGSPPGPHTMLVVSDTGSGMDAETLSHIFEPFFTTKPRDRGTGLGLATVYGIVAQSGGHIAVESEPGRGTTFRVYLPRVDEPAEALSALAAGGEVAGGRETLLLVEDAEELRLLARETLTQRGYHVLDAAAGPEALVLARHHEGPIQLLVTDVVMPRMSGRELAEQLAATQPGLKVLYMSGYTDDAVIRHGVLRAQVAFLQKPFAPTALARKVREVLDASPGSAPLAPRPAQEPAADGR